MTDVVVIGAGHNGLAASCYLARAGYSVLVLEANSFIGGLTTTRALVPAAPKHLLNPGAIDLAWDASPIGRELHLDEHGLRLVAHDPAWAWLGTDGESMLFAKDVDRTVAEIDRFSHRDARTYREYAEVTAGFQDLRERMSGRRHWTAPFAMMRRLADRKLRKLLGAAATASAAELIEGTFVSEPVRGMFASMLDIYGSIAVDGSGLFFLAATTALHKYGIVRPVGGMQAVPNSLYHLLLASGGSVRLDSPVVQIIVADGRARGVRLADGEELKARAVVAAVAPQVTARLLAGSGAQGVEPLKYAPANSVGLGSLVTVMALGGRLEFSPQWRRRDGVDLRTPTLFCGTFAQVMAADLAARNGQVSVNPPWVATIASATDPTVAPEGQDTLYLYAPTPVRPVPDWAHAQPLAEAELVRAAEHALPDISNLEIGRSVQTPADLERQFGAPNGCIFHVDMSLTRLGPLRPAMGWGKHHLTPVPGLVLSGAGTQPGGGVTGIPGQQAANELIHWLNASH